MATASVRDRTKELCRRRRARGEDPRDARPRVVARGRVPLGPLVAPVNPPSTTGTNVGVLRMASRIVDTASTARARNSNASRSSPSAAACSTTPRARSPSSAVIKQDITALNTAIAELQNRARRASASSANKRRGPRLLTVVDTLKSRLMGATKSFKEVLTVRQENVKSQNARRQMFSNNAGPGGRGARPNPFARGAAGPGGSAISRAIAQDGMSGGLGGGGNLQGGRAGGGLLPHAHRRRWGAGLATGGQQQEPVLARQSGSAASARSEALQNVERTITELGGIFQQLATMVAEQGEIGGAHRRKRREVRRGVDSAQTQSRKYLNSISSNRDGSS